LAEPPVVPPTTQTTTTTEGEGRHRHPRDVECGFCESRITTMRGEVIKLSDRAKVLEKLERDVEHWKAECERLRTENAELKNSRTAPAAVTQRGWGT
jgi:hypothetical protein